MLSTIYYQIPLFLMTIPISIIVLGQITKCTGIHYHVKVIFINLIIYQLLGTLSITVLTFYITDIVETERTPFYIVNYGIIVFSCVGTAVYCSCLMIERQASIYFGAKYQNIACTSIFIFLSCAVLGGVAYDVYRDVDSLYLAYIEHAFLDFSLIFFIFYLVTQYKSLKKQNKEFFNQAKFSLNERHHTVYNIKIAKKLIPFTIILLICCYLNEILVLVMILNNDNHKLVTILNLVWYMSLSNRCLSIPLAICYIMKKSDVSLSRYILYQCGYKKLGKKNLVEDKCQTIGNEGNLYFVKLQSQWNLPQ
uniref:G-protein coupled receptors family 1 profile domain-containing protein n=1 Tax=Strongyloides stercoralis TaxID=6248 RepID=A0A0K0E6I6_STRER